MDEGSGRLNERCHFSDFELCYLKRGNRLSELSSLFYIVDRLLHGALCQSNPVGSDVGSGVIEKFHQLGESISFNAYQILFWDPYIVEIEIGCIRGTDSHFSVNPVCFVSGLICFNQKNTVSSRSGGFFRMSQTIDQNEVGHRSIGDHHLVAIDHIFLPFFFGGGDNGGRVASGFGFGNRKPHDPIPFDQGREVLLLLFF